uniref:Uncharacterized protein n=1 Tax=Romanomermis culicivorax TaxID=13658 RepID=A0A915HIL9_ROMCU
MIHKLTSKSLKINRFWRQAIFQNAIGSPVILMIVYSTWSNNRATAAAQTQFWQNDTLQIVMHSPMVTIPRLTLQDS